MSKSRRVTAGKAKVVYRKGTGDAIAEKYLGTEDRNVGYHYALIPKGALGEASKIAEECAEFMDAVEQNVAVMALVELSDLMGAVEAYLAKHHPTITLDELLRMKEVTKRAFEAGHRG